MERSRKNLLLNYEGGKTDGHKSKIILLTIHINNQQF